MSDAVIISLIGAIGTVVGIALTGFVNIRLSRLHKQINGRMEELLETTKKLGNAEGAATEKAKKDVKAK